MTMIDGTMLGGRVSRAQLQQHNTHVRPGPGPDPRARVRSRRGDSNNNNNSRGTTASDDGGPRAGGERDRSEVRALARVASLIKASGPRDTVATEVTRPRLQGLRVPERS